MISKRNQAIKTAFGRGYRSQDGKILGSRNKTPIKLYVNKGGYPNFVCRFCRNGKYIRATVMAHRFVAYQKYGDALFEDNIEVRHLDGNKMNFSDSNIAIGTPSDNHNDMSPEARRKRAENGIRACSKARRRWSNEEVVAIRKRYEEVQSYPIVMSEFGFTSKGSLHYVLNHRYLTEQ